MKLVVRLAEPSDKKAIAALQELPMQGPVRLSIRWEADADDRVVVTEREGQLVAVGRRHCAHHWFGGSHHLVGVLGGMRSSLPVLPRRSTAEMYRLLREVRAPEDPDWDLTAILTDNLPARRLLEAGLPWLPRYRHARDMVTLTFRSANSRQILSSPPDVSETAVDALHATAVVVRNSARVTTICGYAPWLAKIRPLVDRLLRLAGRPGLPSIGTRLTEAFATRTVWTPGDRKSLLGLVQAIRKVAQESGAEMVHWGIPADHPDLAWLARHSRAWRTNSRVYQVHDVEKVPPTLDSFWPEVSLL